MQLVPQDEPPNFKSFVLDWYKSSIALGHFVLGLMGHALKLEVSMGLLKVFVEYTYCEGTCRDAH